MEDYKKVIGERLKYLRKNYSPSSLTTGEVAKRLGVSRSTYTGYELGRRSPNGEKLNRLAEIYNTSVDFITGKIDENETPKNNINIKEILKSGSISWDDKKISDEQAAQFSRILEAIIDDTK